MSIVHRALIAAKSGLLLQSSHKFVFIRAILLSFDLCSRDKWGVILSPDSIYTIGVNYPQSLYYSLLRNLRDKLDWLNWSVNKFKASEKNALTKQVTFAEKGP